MALEEEEEDRLMEDHLVEDLPWEEEVEEEEEGLVLQEDPLDTLETTLTWARKDLCLQE